MAAYDESLVSISLDAAANLAVATGVASEDDTNRSGNQYRFVHVSGEHQVDLYTAGTGEVGFGVLQNKPQGEDHAATVGIQGVSLVEAGEAVTAGSQVRGDASGRAISSGSTPVLGVALHAADAAGELIPVLLDVPGAAAA